jgi:hypothetical protein
MGILIVRTSIESKSLKKFLETHIEIIERFIADYPNPQWSARPMNYKTHRKEDGAAERSLELSKSLLAELQADSFKCSYKNFIELFEKRIANPVFLFVNWSILRGKPYKDLEEKFLESLKKGLLTFDKNYMI